MPSLLLFSMSVNTFYKYFYHLITGILISINLFIRFDKVAAARAVRVNNNPDYNVEVMIAIGKRPALKQRSNSEKTTQRNPIHDFIFEGVFNEK